VARGGHLATDLRSGLTRRYSARMARRSPAARIARDLVRYAMENKKWWLLPIVLVSLLLVALVVVGNTPLAPFIYTLF
jgi:hypothetical protein